MNTETKFALYDICNKYNDVFVIDMYNYIFKYFYANRGLSVIRDGKEIPTGHFFGITRQVLFLKGNFPNCSIIFAVDGHDETRKQINENYKADRVHEIEPSNYVEDILKFCSLVDGVYSIYNPNYEADDVIGSVVTTVKALCEKNNINKNVFILSSDRDMYQLIDCSGICKVRAIKKFGYGVDWRETTEFIGEKEVKDTFNDVEPKDLLKFRAIVGDSSDNLKGYFRYRKANASIIASNFDYIPEEHVLRLKSNVPMRESWKKFLNVILDDFSIFESNYAIMKLKYFDFEIVSYRELQESDVKSILEDINFYELNMYMRQVKFYSTYKEWIDKYSNSFEEVDVDDAISSISVDLDMLLSE